MGPHRDRHDQLLVVRLVERPLRCEQTEQQHRDRPKIAAGIRGRTKRLFWTLHAHRETRVWLCDADFVRTVQLPELREQRLCQR